jgi:hypothetical protein
LKDLIFPDGVGLDHDRLPSHPFQMITPANIYFVTWKLICFAYVIFHAELKYIIIIALSRKLLRDWIFWNAILANLVFIAIPVCFKYVWGICFILNTWGRRFNYNKDSKHVGPITERQTVQARGSTDMLLLLLLLFCYPMFLADHLFIILYIDNAPDSVVKYK